MKKTIFKKAFTLAEVLITLGIIGVVAAMTLPALIQNYQSAVLKTQFKKAYSDLNNASTLFRVHNGMSVSEFAAEDSPKAKDLFKKEFNTILKTNNNRYDTEDDEGNPINAKPYKGKDGKYHGWGFIYDKSQDYRSVCDTGGAFWDGTGRVILLDDPPSSGKNGPKVCIDINGEKGPNLYGIDFFIFLFTTDGYVIPWEQKHKDNQYGGSFEQSGVPEDNIANYCNYNNKSWNGALSCAIYAISNTHPYFQDKDYWHDFIKGR